MKKSLLCLYFLMFGAISFAQEQPNDSAEKDYFDLKFYLGIGLQYTDALDINPFLSESNVPTVRRFPFELSLGFYGDFGKNRVEADFGFYNQDRDRNNFGHELSSANMTLRYLRNIIQFKDQNKFFAGLGISYTTTELEFFDDRESIDLDEPGEFGDIAKLDLNQFYIGPSIGYSIISSDEDKEVFLRIQLSYDFNISSNNWDSSYARVLNGIKETGNRFRLQLILPF